ncbi:hydrogenase maturation nickel metallochaperone HypA [Campylobacter upsaliensis]|uniref:hydrogenase maturation nickel metallochaperone HypA n=1 Tax=Campylobacter upsaliensis TaxID=28080 RepID=UPI001289B279|nr:hydrogenase maturation nickel metallochaperone HypA [Campylobacter upsaliensis]EAH7596552.1 hydrogenase maturation nickel metallochaperone HypA [Campylobacter upsaliensis]EAH9986752.1 hydrogenase maturation nickel metallochaperone HypA [Campylobacter upsaliensis]EAI3917063.1 hydrogenase maturation nickel metallochaperone HypA [Campylobacter upsaliensis]EAJ2426386.1 hydrogenase maturation nickel metallochaperone HypA [Campylobacter upsaliensis]EAJ7017957.1 hydrogenase maturation nickel metal
MHELSIVESLITLCEENATTQNAKEIDEIYVKIGRLSGIETTLFKRCFETFKENSTLCQNAKLFIEIAELEILCLSCGEKSILKENVFQCPQCQSVDLKVLDGDEMVLMRLVMH